MTPPRHQSNQRDVIYSAPFSDEVEAGLINLALNSAECYYKLEEAGISDNFFHGEAAAYLYGLIHQLTEEGQGSHPTQFSILQRIKALAGGGEAYYGYYRQVQAEPITTEWFDRYLKQLVNLFKKRQFLSMAAELAQMASDDKIPAEACTTFSLDRAETIDRATNPLNILDGKQLKQVMTDYYRDAPNRPEGSPWGIKSLDKFTEGSRLGELSILYAPPGFGKSALYQQACYHRAFNLGRPQLWITIGDMTAPQVFNRWMQQETGVSSISLSRGQFEDPNRFNQKSKVKAALVQLAKSPLYIYEDDTLASSDIRRIVKSLLRKEKTLDVYVDHIGQFTDRAENIYEKTTAIAAQLLRCAHNIRDDNGGPLISLNVISPINKAGKYSGSMDLGHAPENIFTLDPLTPDKGGPDPNKPPSEQSGLINFKIEKSRHGGRGAVALFFQADKAKFMEPEIYRV
jgi:replicative DNA helicase